MKKVDTFRFELPHYFTLVDIYPGPFSAEVQKFIEDRYNIKFDDFADNGDAAVTYDLQQEPYNLSVIPIVFDDIQKMEKKSFPNFLGIVAHELLHATNIIIASRNLGKNNSREQDEVAAYIMQNLMTGFSESYENWKKKQHKKETSSAGQEKKTSKKKKSSINSLEEKNDQSK